MKLAVILPTPLMRAWPGIFGITTRLRSQWLGHHILFPTEIVDESLQATSYKPVMTPQGVADSLWTTDKVSSYILNIGLEL